MRTTHRFRFALLLFIGVLAVALAPNQGRAEPRKGRSATQADIERLDKKIDEQQKTIEKIVRLHQQFLQAMLSVLGEGAAPSPPTDAAAKPDSSADGKPKDDATTLVATTQRPAPRPDAKPAAKPAKAKVGTGTIVGKVRGAEDAFVYIDDVVATARGTAMMRQEGRQFVPQVLVVQRGTHVEFPNKDAVFHNVFSVTPDNSFDLGSYPQGESKGVTLTKAGVVNIYCNMHPQMVGYILVVPNAFYAHAGKDGFYRLANVPAGHHRIVAWAPSAKPVASEVDVTDSEVTTAEVELKKGRTAPHVNKDGLPYGSYKD